MAMYFGAAAIVAVVQQGVRCRDPNLVITACGSTEDVYLSKNIFFICKHLKVLMLCSAKCSAKV